MSKEGIIYAFNPDGPNVVTDELSPTSFMALREVKWEEGSDYHLDYRRYFVKQDGTEMPGKGTAIPSPDKLISAMLGCGYGDTRQTVKAMWGREDMLPALGDQVADYSDKEYKKFKSDLDKERDRAIEEKKSVMSSDEFMENL